MATFKSTQITNIDLTPPKLPRSDELGGRIRVAFFDFTTPAAGAPAVGDTVLFARLPKDVRILDFMLVWDALSTGVALAGADIGLSSAGDSARYIAALNMDAAGNTRATPTIDKVPETVLTKNEPTYFQGVVTGEAWAVSSKVRGFVAYVTD